MTCLFLNTATNYLSLALIKNNEVIDEVYEQLDKNLSKMALERIRQMLLKNNTKVEEIENIICVSGPGSFTGLRVGVTIAKSMSWVLKCKLLSASSLQVMASSIEDTYVVPLINARHDHVYAGIYDKNKKPVMKDCYIEIENLKKELEKLDGSYTLVSSDNFDFEVEKYKPNIKKFLEIYENKEEDVFLFEPNYLKKTQAEEELNDKRNN